MKSGTITSNDIRRLNIKWITDLHCTVTGCKKRTESAKECMDCERFYGYFDGTRIRNVPITISGHKRYMATEVLCRRRKKDK